MHRLHGLVGFYGCLVLGFLCLFGTLTSIGHELDWLADPALRVDPAPTLAGWGALDAALRRAHPDWVLQRITAPEGQYFAAEARMVAPDGTARLVYVDPYHAVVTGARDRETIHAMLRRIHRQFYLPNAIILDGRRINVGVYLSTPFGFALLVMLVSGVVIYPQFWRGLFRLRLRQGSAVLLHDLHRLVAGWAVWFLAVIALTASWYLAERLLADTGMRLEPPPPAASRPAGVAVSMPLDDLVARGRAAFPGLEVRAVYFPARPGAPLALAGQAGDLLVRDRANRVWLDPADGRVLRVDRIDGAGPLRRWDAMANPLHYGDFAGTASRLVWFVFGCGLTALVFTGAWMYLARLRRERATRRRLDAMRAARAASRRVSA
ncbi:PepSY-associated TM helix domain-containing protein [Ferrovibrio xuzhouensis]|uniref:PepSY-associated TM helix domain-containing protein n=1 Tax=Ferrovibrio xuzhouensis TaxID=1576914 RepID=A0ABV7VEW4_9PROT